MNEIRYHKIDLRQPDRDILRGILPSIRNQRKTARKKLLVAAWKWGGHGDFMQLVAFARALKRHWGEKAHIVVIGTFTGVATTIDQARLPESEGIHVILTVPTENWTTLDFLRKHFDVVYHAPGYVVKRWDRDGADPEGLARADDCFRPFADFYFDYPDSQIRLADLGKSQWQLMSESSGIDVSADDLHAGLDAPKFGDALPRPLVRTAGKRNWNAVRMPRVDYACIHNTPGGQSLTKCVPPGVMQAVIDHLKARGLRAVQLGCSDERLYDGVWDRRNARWPLTARLLQGAKFYVGLEGGLAHLARAVGCRSLVFFGSTPVCVFGYAENINVSTGACPGCFWKHAEWFKRCEREDNPMAPLCMNMPDAEGAIAAVEEACERWL